MLSVFRVQLRAQSVQLRHEIVPTLSQLHHCEHCAQILAQFGLVAGSPDFAHISARLIERQNLTMRMSMRRFTRLTNGFSKKVDNRKAAVSQHFAHYNFVRLHQSLRITPAMAAGVSDRLWTLEELVEQTSW